MASRTLTSAWIETFVVRGLSPVDDVALSRVRGLKPVKGVEAPDSEGRTLTSAWIETPVRDTCV